MDYSKWDDIERLFDEALEKPAGERETWLEANCDKDSDIYRGVMAMLKAQTTAGDFLGNSVFEDSTDLLQNMDGADDEYLRGNKKLGSYKLLKKLGFGGMGTVYLAEHSDEHIQRKEAIKVLRAELSQKNFIRRFIQEQQVLSTLEHVGIARLYDAEFTDGGRPWFAMEYVDGLPIDAYCNENSLSVNERLQLFIDVCEAVHYAHRNLIVHRDIKPSNVLIDGNGIPKLLDFGIAKLLSDNKNSVAPQTQTGRHWVTPQYAAPEQIKEEPTSVSTDVYALGTLLHKLLVGVTPFNKKNTSTREMERQICDETPTLPSIAAARLNESGKASKVLKGDLDTIMMKALRKEPGRRYKSLETFIDDIRRYLNRLPVQARRDTIAYRSKKFTSRHRISLITTAVIALLITGFAIFHVKQINQERNRAQVAAKKAKTVTEFIIDLFQQANPLNVKNKEKVAATLTLLKPASRQVLTKLDNQPEIQAKLLYKFGVLYHKLGRPDLAKPMLKHSLAIRRSLFNSPNKKVATTLHAYGMLIADISPVKLAAKYLKKAAQARRKLYEGDHPKLAKSLLLWARYLPLDNPKKQILFEKAMDMYRRLYGRRSAEVAEAIYTYHLLGYSSATQKGLIRAFRKVLSIQKEQLGIMNFHTASTMHDLGLKLKGKKALSLLKKSYQIGLQTKGLKNKSVRIMGINVAATFYEREQYEDAAPILQHIMMYSRNLLPDSSEGIAFISYWYGRNLAKLQQFKKAEASLRKALAIYKQLSPPNIHAWRVQNILGKFLIQWGHYREAEKELLENYTFLKEYVGIENRYTQTAIKLLAQLYDKWNKPQKAAQYRKLLAEDNES